MQVYSLGPNFRSFLRFVQIVELKGFVQTKTRLGLHKAQSEFGSFHQVRNVIFWSTVNFCMVCANP